MHLHPGLGRVPDGTMGEVVEVEIRAELAIEPHEQVLVERRRHPERVVVGRHQDLAPRV